MNTIRVLLVDDHVELRTELRRLIASQGDFWLVAEVGSAREAIRLALEETPLEETPTVVVMDLSLPDGDGITATAEIVHQRPELRVLGLSRHEDMGYVERMLAAGACGYVLKRSIAGSLVTAIRTVAAGGMYIDPAFGSKQQESQRLHRKATREPVRVQAGTISELTAQEVAVLQRVARNDSNHEIAHQLDMLVPAVAEHKAQAMQKLGLRTRSDVLRYAEAQGWKR
ncbi:MAG TPA: response regulator transcription factor [Roseiflexaceae bacterium]|nr:response regulator transcription factor [Roseiflexaceae bacterium]